MARSYLYGGDTKHLTPVQYQLEQLYDRLDTPQRRLSSEEFFKSNEFAQFLSGKYGDLASQVPPGSQILNQTPFKLTYKDAEGYEHTITRAGADAANAGAISRQTDRPPILPQSKGQQSTLEALRERVQQGYTQPAQLAALPPEAQAQLDAISAAERGDIQKQATDARGQLVAQLYGNKVNQSSIADDQSARFLEVLGRVNQQQQAGAAQRGIGLQQYLTDLIQRQGEGAANLYGNLTGQGTTRDIAGAGLGLDAAKLEETIRQFNQQYGLQDKSLNLQQQQIDNENSPFNKFIKTLNAASGVAQAASGGLSAYGALTKRRP